MRSYDFFGTKIVHIVDLPSLDEALVMRRGSLQFLFLREILV